MPATAVEDHIPTRIVIASEAEDYIAAIPGYDIEVLRLGTGTGPNVTRVASFEDVMVTSADVRFPMLGKARINDRVILVNVITSAPPGSRWCGIDLEPGTVMLYGPGALHTGISPVGLGFSFIALDVDAVEESADRLEMNLELPERGRVRTLDPTPKVRSLSTVVRSLGRSVEYDNIATEHRLKALHAAVAALSVEPSAHEAGKGAKIDDRGVVHTCVEYAEATGRIPTIAQMCLVAHVSERRLRYAFMNVFGLPPSRYFKYRSLSAARQRLMNDERNQHTVSRISVDVGYNNFGRFAKAYRATYGELPSATLASRR